MEIRKGKKPPKMSQKSRKAILNSKMATPSLLNGIQRTPSKKRTPAVCGMSLSTVRTSDSIHMMTTVAMQSDNFKEFLPCFMTIYTATEYATRLRILPALLHADIHTFTLQAINEGVTLLALNRINVVILVNIPARVPTTSATDRLINRIRSDTEMADFMTKVTAARLFAISAAVETSSNTTLNVR